MYGLRLRRSPTLAAAGFIIPIVNFWWPYQAAADLLPPGSPDRRLAGWWWGSYIATIPLAFVVGVLLPAFSQAATPPTVTINDVSVTEGNAGTKVATFAITLSANRMS